MLNFQSTLAIAKSRVVITKPGKYIVKVQNVSDLMFPEDDRPAHYIISTNAMDVSQYNKVRELLTSEQDPEHDFSEQLNGTNISGNVWLKRDGNAPDFLPKKGSRVYAHFDYVTLRSGEQGLRIVSFEPIEAESASKPTFEVTEGLADTGQITDQSA